MAGPESHYDTIQPQGRFIRTPFALLDHLESVAADIQFDAEPEGFFSQLSQDNYQTVQISSNALLEKLASKGYIQESDQPTFNDLTTMPMESRFFEVQLRHDGNHAQLRIGSFTFQHEDGSRGFLDLVLRQGEGLEGESMAVLTLTNLWSDQPGEVQEFHRKAPRFNNENRFYVDVAQVLDFVNPRVIWYRYWWFNSHHHHWWWYGTYWWWWWRFRWFHRPWWWWWNWWWPWWHWHHWWGWSSWWGSRKCCHH